MIEFSATIFEFSGGPVFTYRGSWCANGLRTSWESAWRIIGTRGSLTWDGADDLRAEVATDRPVPGQPHLRESEPVAVPEPSPQDRVGGHLGVIEDFLAAVASGRPPETRGEDNIHSLAMVFGAIASAATGRKMPVAVPAPRLTFTDSVAPA